MLDQLTITHLKFIYIYIYIYLYVYIYIFVSNLNIKGIFCRHFLFKKKVKAEIQPER